MSNFDSTTILMTGACLCGAIGFEIQPPSNWCAHCHCSMCRRAHGAAFVTWLGADSDRVRLRDPEGLLRWYHSSSEARRGFCARCGSQLFFESDRWPGETHVVRASIAAGVDREPQGHVFWDSHVDWIELGDDLPRRAELGQ